MIRSFKPILVAGFALACSVAQAATFNLDIVAEVDTFDPNIAAFMTPTFGDPSVSGEGLITFDITMSVPDGKTIQQLTDDPDPDFGGGGEIRWTVGGVDEVFSVTRIARTGTSAGGFTLVVQSNETAGTSVGEADSFSFFLGLRDENPFTSTAILANELDSIGSLSFIRGSVRRDSGTASGPLIDFSSAITRAAEAPPAPVPLPAGLPLLAIGLGALYAAKTRSPRT